MVLILFTLIYFVSIYLFGYLPLDLYLWRNYRVRAFDDKSEAPNWYIHHEPWCILGIFLWPIVWCIIPIIFLMWKMWGYLVSFHERIIHYGEGGEEEEEEEFNQPMNYRAGAVVDRDVTTGWVTPACPMWEVGFWPVGKPQRPELPNLEEINNLGSKKLPKDWKVIK